MIANTEHKLCILITRMHKMFDKYEKTLLNVDYMKYLKLANKVNDSVIRFNLPLRYLKQIPS